MTLLGRVLARCPTRAAGAALCVIVLCAACRRQDEKVADKGAPPSERFSFNLPGGFELVQLRGEGSERLRAPVGARVERTERGFRVEAGPDFALEVLPSSPQLAELKPASGVAPVYSEPDVAVFQSGDGGYSVVVVRDLVPEWDETQAQRLACGSAGGAVSGVAPRADNRGFSKTAAQIMVAACRTLELPPLE